jgi:hypothetical protein
VDLLAKQLKSHDLLSALDQLPKGLEETYQAAVDRITARENPEHVKVALKTLKWITFAREPLELEALLHALVVKEDTKDIDERDLPDIDKVISLCVGLVAVDHEGDRIRFVHETTQQYFRKYFRDVRNEDGDVEITKTCLVYFSFPAFSRQFDSEVRMKACMRKYRLISYASSYCFVHLREGGLEEKLYQAIVKTFENPGTRDAVYQMGFYLMEDWCPFRSGSLGIHLLHLASMHGLFILCRVVLRQCNTVQRL